MFHGRRSFSGVPALLMLKLNMRFRFYAKAFLIGFTLLICRPAFTQDALQLFHKMQAALGGADKIAGIHDFENIVRAGAWRDGGRYMGVLRKRVRLSGQTIFATDPFGNIPNPKFRQNNVSFRELA
jgi:hypothetical protein